MRVKSSDITPEKLYRQRRRMIGLGLASLALPLTSKLIASSDNGLDSNLDAISAMPEIELTPTKLDIINTYNNYYEFGFGKSDPSEAKKTLITSPWSVEIGGAGADKPGIYDIADLHSEHDIENRLYRFRCVEAWSMVVPWNGIPLAKIIKAAQPNSKARYVRFQTLNDPKQMPNANWAGGPYIEGLTISEAVHPLTLLATGIYDNPLEQQTGAPIRLVVPWKYGFKSIKSISSIRFVEKQPNTTWPLTAPNEYGFYSNVNNIVNHPRWSQNTERRIGEFKRRETLMFNGYEEEVSHLYKGMDLSKFY